MNPFLLTELGREMLAGTKHYLKAEYPNMTVPQLNAWSRKLVGQYIDGQPKAVQPMGGNRYRMVAVHKQPEGAAVNKYLAANAATAEQVGRAIGIPLRLVAYQPFPALRRVMPFKVGDPCPLE